MIMKNESDLPVNDAASPDAVHGTGQQQSDFFRERITRQIQSNPGPAFDDEMRQIERTPDRCTIGDFIGAVLGIETEDEARQFYEGAVAYYKAHPGTHTAVDTARANIGWCFGEGMPQERIDMWVRACGAFHPIFGVRKPTPEEAFESGMKAGERRTGQVK